MVKLKSITSQEEREGITFVTASLYADTKEEVTDSIRGSDIPNLRRNVELDTGTMVITADFQVAQLNSSHHWVWG